MSSTDRAPSAAPAGVGRRLASAAAQTLLIATITIALLELASWAVWTVRLRLTETTTGWYEPNGELVNGPVVLPVRRNFSYHWKRQDFDVNFTTNSRGLREEGEIDDQRVRVAFVGDSFTFGHGVSNSQRYSAWFARAAGLAPGEAVSYSYLNGFQPEHYEYFLRRMPRIRPRWIVVGLYLGNDLGADLAETRYDVSRNRLALPHRRVGAGGYMHASSQVYVSPLAEWVDVSHFARLLASVLNSTPYRSRILRQGVLGPNEPNDPALELGRVDLRANRAIQSLTRMRSLARERGGDLAVVVMAQNFYHGATGNPHLHQTLKPRLDDVVGGPNLLKAVRSVCRELDLTCLDSTAVLDAEDFFPTDGHWTAEGNRKVGEALARMLMAR